MAPQPQYVCAIVNALFLATLGILFFIDAAGSANCRRVMVFGGIILVEAAILILYTVLSCVCSPSGKYDANAYSRPIIYMLMTFLMGLLNFGYGFWVIAAKNSCQGRTKFWDVLTIILMVTGVTTIIGCTFLWVKRRTLVCIRMSLLRYWTSMMIISPLSIPFLLLFCCKSPADEPRSSSETENRDDKNSANVELPSVQHDAFHRAAHQNNPATYGAPGHQQDSFAPTPSPQPQIDKLYNPFEHENKNEDYSSSAYG